MRCASQPIRKARSSRSPLSDLPGFRFGQIQPRRRQASSARSASSNEACVGMIRSNPLVRRTSSIDAGNEQSANFPLRFPAVLATLSNTRSPALPMWARSSQSMMSGPCQFLSADRMDCANSCALAPSIRPATRATKTPLRISVSILIDALYLIACRVAARAGKYAIRPDLASFATTPVVSVSCFSIRVNVVRVPVPIACADAATG